MCTGNLIAIYGLMVSSVERKAVDVIYLHFDILSHNNSTIRRDAGGMGGS